MTDQPQTLHPAETPADIPDPFLRDELAVLDDARAVLELLDSRSCPPEYAAKALRVALQAVKPLPDTGTVFVDPDRTVTIDGKAIARAVADFQSH